MSDADLESRLADLAAHLAYPPTPDLAGAVGWRLRTRSASPRLFPFARTLRRSLLLAAALVLLVVGGALAVRIGLDLLSIERAPLPSPSIAAPSGMSSDPLGSRLGLGRLLDLDEARTEAAFSLQVPEVMGAPDAVYLGGGALRGQVAFVYAPRDDVPASALLGGAGLLITQNRGMPDEGLAHKILNISGVTVEPVQVNGSPGVWISGEPHFFWYFAPDGSVIPESRRLVGDTLAWERNGVLYRIEGAISLERALEIAQSMR